MTKLDFINSWTESSVDKHVYTVPDIPRLLHTYSAYIHIARYRKVMKYYTWLVSPFLVHKLDMTTSSNLLTHSYLLTW